MNTCVLMARIVRNPELRYTQDTQTPVTHMLVEFDGMRTEDPPSTLRVVGWGNFATEIQEKYHEGDCVIIEGRLSMNTVERPEGFKEKRAELVASRIHTLTNLGSFSATSTAYSEKVVPLAASRPSAAESAEPGVSPVADFPTPTPAATEPTERNLDDIPF